MKRTRWHILLGVGLLLVGLAAFVYVPYRVADAQYEQLVRLQPKTRQQVEKALRLYTSKRVDMDKSLWGRDYTLGAQEVCIQYLILAREPIEVVYGPNDEVHRVFASYE